MIRMVPDFISPEVKSDAEKKLFNDFKKYETEEKIIVLHSLGLAEHTKHIYGETDFVIVCREGILCIEVKGGVVSRSDVDGWTFTNRHGKKEKKEEGPFQQVQGNMQSLRKHILKKTERYENIHNCQYACCVLFPDCVFNTEYSGPDIIPEVLFDKRFPWDLNDLIEQSFRYWRDNLLEHHGFEGSRLSDDDIDTVVQYLRGDFQCVPVIKDMVKQIYDQLCILTDDQYDALEGAAGNPRVLISGVAGSGKTVLAMELARRFHWENQKVLYLCYNRNIADYVRNIFEKERQDIDVVTLHSFLLKACGMRFIENQGDDFYRRELPNMFMKTECSIVYDHIIIDEGQDLFAFGYLKCINRILRHGFNGGMWAIFYDPNQNLFNKPEMYEEGLDYLGRCGSTSYVLRKNCRNTRQIASAITYTTNIPLPTKANAYGPVPVIKEYRSKEEEFYILEKTIQELRNGGLKSSEIAILSKHTEKSPYNCMYGRRFAFETGVLRTGGRIWEMKKNDVFFSTISAFKGLEAKAVIITDMEHFSDQESRLLNYVGMSRACVLLYLFYSKEADEDRRKVLNEVALQG